MKRSPFLHKWAQKIPLVDRIRRLLTNGYFWTGAVLLLFIGGGSYYLLNNVMMPAYTRYDAGLQVPDVTGTGLEEAREILAAHGLALGEGQRRFDQTRPLNEILDQTPPPFASVKPGRTIYVTINAGVIPRVTVPRVLGLSLKQAGHQLKAAGLRVESEWPDPLPYLHANAITKQEPAPGTVVQQGTGVQLWYGTGLGDNMVQVPDVTGLSPDEAQQVLESKRLRSVVLQCGDEGEAPGAPTVMRQDKPVGTSTNEGSEIRLYTYADRACRP